MFLSHHHGQSQRSPKWWKFRSLARSRCWFSLRIPFQFSVWLGRRWQSWVHVNPASPTRALRSTLLGFLGPWHSSVKPGATQLLLGTFRNCFPHNTAHRDPLTTKEQQTPWIGERHSSCNAQIGFGRCFQDICWRAKAQSHGRNAGFCTPGSWIPIPQWQTSLKQ